VVVSQARVVPSLRARLAPLGIVLLSLAASAPSLSNGFAVDDVPIIASDARIRSLDAPWRFFAQTYWPPTTKSALYRPLTSLAFAVEWRLGHGKPWAYHATNVLLYALVSLSVYRLAVLVLGGLAGWWAAALFAVHPVHVEAVGNSVGQSELWAALLVVLAVRHYIVVRRARDIATRDTALLSALYAAACLCKEHALMLPGLLIAAEMTVLEGELSDASRRSGLRRLGLALAIIATAFWSLRTLVIGDFTGDQPSITFVGMSFPDRLLTMLSVVPEWFRLFFAPIHLKLEYRPQEIPRATSFGPAQLLGVILLLLAGIEAVRARRRAPALTFAILWSAVTLFPVSNLVLVTGATLAERTLFLPSVGATLALGVAISWLVAGAARRTGARRYALLFTGGIVLAIAATRSAVRQPVWRNTRTFKAQALVDSPRSYRPHWWEARRLYLARDLAGAQREFGLALALFPHDPEMLADIGNHYAALNRCGEAVQLYRRSLRLAPQRRWIYRHIIGCLASSGRLQEARQEALAAIARGDPFADEALAGVDSVRRARQEEGGAHR
jgi:hypothetical protein